MTQPDRGVPRDAKIIEEILKSMGVQEWEPRVVNQLLEFMYRYTAEVLQEAQVYSEHAGRGEVDLSDVKLAVKAYISTYFTTPPPRDVTQRIAMACNQIPLRPIKGPPGLRLPPEEHTLTTPGWQVRLPSKKSQEGEAMDTDKPPESPPEEATQPPALSLGPRPSSTEGQAFQAFALKAKK